VWHSLQAVVVRVALLMRDREPRNEAEGLPQVQPVISFVGRHILFHPVPRGGAGLQFKLTHC
jgi:hypothetical protein